MDPAAADASSLLTRLVASCLGTFDMATMYLGLQLGLYRSLAGDGPATSTELAGRTGTVERYVREWLEQQTVTGVLHVDDPGAGAGARRYTLPAAHAEVLLDADNPNFMGAYPQQMISVLVPLPSLMNAFRNGGGVPYEAYGKDCREGIAAGNRVAFINLLGSEWFPAIPELHARLRATPSARVADVGCGLGWSAISIAKAYPGARVDGLDLDEASVHQARQNARDSGVADRVTFAVRDAADPTLTEKYDLVVAFETIHDMARPVEALRAMRRLAADRGMVLVVDERVNEKFTVDPGDIERLYYGFSVLHCLPAGMAAQPSAATGTVMRPATLRSYAQQAGFRDIEELPIDFDFWRFYRVLG
ncbi:MAG: methyltransferase domain-containing protein [Candidatus Dormibacteraeota bacterium]|nr:methyltransferase domain-containing protein [Candidatus Dormibacteraeota bacterium]